MNALPWLCWSVPFIGFFMTAIAGKRIKRIAGLIEPSFAFISAICAILMGFQVFEGGIIHEKVPWIPVLNVNIGVLVDPLSAIMANIVAWIGLLIMIYSVKYMEGDPSVMRFWALMNLFIGSMLLLVLSDNFIQMFVGWELVGVASFSLIGYYYRDEPENWVLNYPPSHCAMKAFVVTKVGDLMMLAGALLIYIYAGTLDFMELANRTDWVGLLSSKGLLLPALLLLLGGPLGKSAQFPFHEWLPEAMAGPTPVSALIHAATMVKAGVYFIARILPILHYVAWTMGYGEVFTFFYVVAIIGAFTTFLAGTQAMVAKELKRILAYSTISQIGYMMLGLGVAGLIKDYVLGLAAAIFHLMSHAVFKALLFLSAGSVIHVAETKNVYEMGGLRRYMPITFYSMLIGALALAGVPPLSGFWSKDAVLLACALSGKIVPLILGLATAGVTMFYSLRMIGLIFLGNKSEHLKGLEEEGHHLHEVHPVMWVPYAILAGLSIAIGISGPFLEKFLHHMLALNLLSQRGAYLELSIGWSIKELTESEGSMMWHVIMPGLSVAMLLLGAVPAYILYVTRSTSPEKLVRENSLLSSLYQFLRMRWYINPMYYAVFVDGLIGLSRGVYAYIEDMILEGFNNKFAESFKAVSLSFFHYLEKYTFEGFNNLIVVFFKAASSMLRKAQTGLISINVIEMVIGMLLLTLLMLGFVIGGM